MECKQKTLNLSHKKEEEEENFTEVGPKEFIEHRNFMNFDN